MPSSLNHVTLSAPLRRAGFHLEEMTGAVRREEMETARQAAYQHGFADASAFLSQQLAEQRADVIQLMEQTFKSLEDQRGELLRQVGAVLPGLATEIARRVLCGLEPDRNRIERTVDEVLGELSSGTKDIEITMHPADLELLGRYEEKFREPYPGLRFVGDGSLAVGDCRLRSSFGLVDATIATKLENVSRSLR
ncbi:MAG: flagellar assembly protein FliH [Chthoniobacter sp.]|jgi:flagellar biosynthesis/type III secretory pathway protein FliH|nr:flagellar assembly protein FliH [Chthoniobacter sp.]